MGNFPGRFRAEDSSGTCPAYLAWDGLKGRRRRAASPGGPPTQWIRDSRYIRRRRTHPPPARHRRQGNRNPGVFRRVSAELFGGKSHRALSPGTWLSLMTTALVSVAFPGPPHHFGFPGKRTARRRAPATVYGAAVGFAVGTASAAVFAAAAAASSASADVALGEVAGGAVSDVGT